MLKKFKNVLQNFDNKKILVIGDVMLDQFMLGEVRRISPEAPVPIVEVKKHTFIPGGAGNVANNISSLSGKPIIVGIIGNDDTGKRLKKEFEERKIDISGLVVDNSRSTILKTRVIAHNQQVVRIDREEKKEIDKKIIQKLKMIIERKISDVSAVVFSDYNKGLTNIDFVEDVIDLSKKYKKIVVVDPKPQNLLKFKNVTIIAPNQTEAYISVGKIVDEKYPIEKVGFEILELLNSSAVLITQGENGMTLFEKNRKVTHIKSIASEVYDVTGAGDTVVATLTLSLSTGADFLISTKLANYAAGVVVRKIGTATVTKDELLDVIQTHNV